MKKLYYIETGIGCGIREGEDKDSVVENALKEAGTNAGVQIVRKATQEDIGWVKRMGGYIPNQKQL